MSFLRLITGQIVFYPLDQGQQNLFLLQSLFSINREIEKIRLIIKMYVSVMGGGVLKGGVQSPDA